MQEEAVRSWQPETPSQEVRDAPEMPEYDEMGYPTARAGKCEWEHAFTDFDGTLAAAPCTDVATEALVTWGDDGYGNIVATLAKFCRDHATEVRNQPEVPTPFPAPLSETWIVCPMARRPVPGGEVVGPRPIDGRWEGRLYLGHRWQLLAATFPTFDEAAAAVAAEVR